MIKNLFDLTDHEIDKLLNGPVLIYEKMDLTYFKICVDELGITAYKTPYFKAVDDVDIICNSVYKDIQNFVDTLSKHKHDEILNTLGPCKIGFFYMPVSKTKVIDYYNSYTPNFILSDLHTEDPWKCDKTKLGTLFEGYAGPEPFIGEYNYSDSDKEMIKQCISECRKENTSKYDIEELVRAFVLNEATYSDLLYSEIEGIVIKSGKKQYQIKVNDVEPIVDKSVTKVYRDTILKDFAHVIISDNDYLMSVIEKNEPYVLTMCEFFVEYMNRTDILNRLTIEPEDILPPHIGYFGKMTLDLVPSNTARLLCRYNILGENVLKLLLYTFKNINPKKFTDMSDTDVELLTYFEKQLHIC